MERELTRKTEDKARLAYSLSAERKGAGRLLALRGFRDHRGGIRWKERRVGGGGQITSGDCPSHTMKCQLSRCCLSADCAGYKKMGAVSHSICEFQKFKKFRVNVGDLVFPFSFTCRLTCL